MSAADLLRCLKDAKLLVVELRGEKEAAVDTVESNEGNDDTRFWLVILDKLLLLLLSLCSI